MFASIPITRNVPHAQDYPFLALARWTNLAAVTSPKMGNLAHAFSGIFFHTSGKRSGFLRRSRMAENLAFTRRYETYPGKTLGNYSLERLSEQMESGPIFLARPTNTQTQQSYRLRFLALPGGL